MRVLYGAASSTFRHAGKFRAELERCGVQYGVVLADDIVYQKVGK